MVQPEGEEQDGKWEGRNKGELHPLLCQVASFNSFRVEKHARHFTSKVTCDGSFNLMLQVRHR